MIVASHIETPLEQGAINGKGQPSATQTPSPPDQTFTSSLAAASQAAVRKEPAVVPALTLGRTTSHGDDKTALRKAPANSNTSAAKNSVQSSGGTVHLSQQISTAVAGPSVTVPLPAPLQVPTDGTPQPVNSTTFVQWLSSPAQASDAASSSIPVLADPGIQTASGSILASEAIASQDSGNSDIAQASPPLSYLEAARAQGSESPAMPTTADPSAPTQASIGQGTAAHSIPDSSLVTTALTAPQPSPPSSLPATRTSPQAPMVSKGSASSGLAVLQTSSRPAALPVKTSHVQDRPSQSEPTVTPAAAISKAAPNVADQLQRQLEATSIPLPTLQTLNPSSNTKTEQDLGAEPKQGSKDVFSAPLKNEKQATPLEASTTGAPAQTISASSVVQVSDPSSPSQDNSPIAVSAPQAPTVDPHVLDTSASPLPTPAKSSGHVAGAGDAATSATVSTPQPFSAINTSKLIQASGHAEMRIGMNSTEFGNISIRTSTTSGLISTKISLDHSDLAKTLAVHLPEMQAKLNQGQSGNVQIQMTGTATSHGSSGNSSQDSQQSRQPSPGQKYSPQNTKNDSTETSMYSPVIGSSNGAITDTRLDVRV